MVYVARPDRHLMVTDGGRFAYSDGPRIRHVLSSANPLFISSAAAFGKGTIAVVLTGAGADGTDGVQAVKACGGIVIAQDCQTSEHFGMPSSAIGTGSVDYVLPLDEIAPALVRLASDQPLQPALVQSAVTTHARKKCHRLLCESLIDPPPVGAQISPTHW